MKMEKQNKGNNSASAEGKRWFEGLFPNRDAYSWFVLILLVIGEGLALLGLRSKEWLFTGPGIFVSIAIGVFLVYLGRKANHRFGIRSVILTKLLANAISPRRLGTIYLLLFRSSIFLAQKRLQRFLRRVDCYWDVCLGYDSTHLFFSRGWFTKGTRAFESLRLWNVFRRCSQRWL